MIRLRLLPPALLLTVGVTVGCDDAAKPPAAGVSRSLVILHTNDEHSHVLGAGPESDDYPAPTVAGTGAIKGGLARRAVVLDRERAAAKTAGADVLTVSAGDNVMGTLMQVPFENNPIDFTLMKAVKYDVTTLGNHEFDFGPKTLAHAIGVAQTGGSTLPVVATNIQFSSTSPDDDELAALFDESGTDTSKPIHRVYLQTTANGLKVGFVGLLGAVASTYAPLKTPVTFSLPPGGDETKLDEVKAQLYVDLQKQVDHLRNDLKADLVVALSHSGVNMKDATLGEDHQIAVNVTGIDVIVSGHTHSEFPVVSVTNPKSNRPVFIQQAGYFGRFVGKLALTVDDKGVVTLDTASSRLLPVDDTIIGSDATVNSLVDGVIKSLEGTKLAGKSLSFLEQTLSAIEGAPVADDPAQAGELFFRTLGKAPFGVKGIDLFKETPLMNLVADAELAEANKADVGGDTWVSLTVQGVMRADLDMGKTGNIAFADVFRVLPLGISPVDGTVGYPLCRFTVFAAELRAALELSTGYAYHNDDSSSYYMVPGGLKVEFDTNKKEFDFKCTAAGCTADPANGRITKITMATNPVSAPEVFDKVIYDPSDPGAQLGWVNGFDLLTSVPVVTSYYIAAYAKANGVNLKSANPPYDNVQPNDTILRRKDGSEVKEWEALGSFIKSAGTLPSLYDAGAGGFPRRMLCTGPVCVK